MKEPRLAGLAGWLTALLSPYGSGGAARQPRCAGHLQPSSATRLVVDLWARALSLLMLSVHFPGEPMCSGRSEPGRWWDAGQGGVWGGLLRTQVSANLGCAGKVNEVQVVLLGNLSNVLLAGE